MSIPYPSQYAEEWFATWQSMMSSLDGHHFAAFEDRNLFALGGGTWTFNASTGVVTWSAGLVFGTPSTGNAQTLASGSKALEDGEMLTVDLSRGASTSVTLAATVDTVIAPNVATVAICIRYGDRLYFRNGAVLVDGASLAVFSGGSVSRPVDRRDVFTATAGQTTFVPTYTPDANSIPMVIRSGVVMVDGSSNDYQIVSGNVVFNYGVPVGQLVQVRYWT
jgi:hypothetical protein